MHVIDDNFDDKALFDGDSDCSDEVKGEMTLDVAAANAAFNNNNDNDSRDVNGNSPCGGSPRHALDGDGDGDGGDALFDETVVEDPHPTAAFNDIDTDVFEVRTLKHAFQSLTGAIVSFSKFVPRDIVCEVMNHGRHAELGVEEHPW
jgi:hypothetical protein